MTAFDLTPEEHEILLFYRDSGSRTEARRAQIVLLSAEGTKSSEIARAVALSNAQVHRWRRAWREENLGIFQSLEDHFPEVAQRQLSDTTVMPEHDTPSDDASGKRRSSAGSEGLDFGAVEDVLEEVRVRPGAPPHTEPSLPLPHVPGVDGPRLPLILAETVGILPDDSMPEAGRKVLFFHFERMLLHEPGSRLGEDIEAVHDMRVAIRRMRSAVRVLEPFFEREAFRSHRKSLREVGTVLGTVRDLDVFMEKTAVFLQANPDLDLSPLIEEWQQMLATARHKLIEYLDSEKYRRFVRDFYTFLTVQETDTPTPESAGPHSPSQVRHVVPRLIYERYEQVRAYETDAAVARDSFSTLHALRIDLKRLRYILEFFEEVLGPEAAPVIKGVKGLQDHLGDLSDADVAVELLQDFLDRQIQVFSGIPRFIRPDMSGVEAYRAAREAERAKLLASFPAAWQRFLNKETRRNLALAVSAL